MGDWVLLSLSIVPSTIISKQAQFCLPISFPPNAILKWGFTLMITHCEHMLVVSDLDELVTVLTFLKDP